VGFDCLLVNCLVIKNSIYNISPFPQPQPQLQHSASKLYATAKNLVDGVLLTAADADDQHRLRVYASSVRDKHRACRQREADLEA
jgi:hypothetical protein